MGGAQSRTTQWIIVMVSVQSQAEGGESCFSGDLPALLVSSTPLRVTVGIQRTMRTMRKT